MSDLHIKYDNVVAGATVCMSVTSSLCVVCLTIKIDKTQICSVV